MAEHKYSSLPECLPYHPLSDLSTKSGYYPNISTEQLHTLQSLYSLVVKEGININTDPEDECLKLLRFLRARKYDVSKSFEMLKEDCRWRQLENRLHLRFELAEEVLDCDVSKIYNFFPTWIQGVDKQLRPVSYRQFGKFEIWNVLKLTTMERLIRFHAWETEQSLRIMYGQSAATGYNIETFVLVIDAAGWNMGLATSDAFAFIKGMAVTDSDHYPERLGTMVIINAPSMLSWAWGIIKGFLDAVTKEKINIIGSNPKDWKPVLLKYIDIDQIPEQYGGTAPTLAPADAIANMNPPRDGTTVDGHSADPSSKKLSSYASVTATSASSSSSSLGSTSKSGQLQHAHSSNIGQNESNSSANTSTGKRGFFGRSNTTPVTQSVAAVPVPKHRDAACQTDICAEEYIILDNSQFKSHNKYWTSMYHKLVDPLVVTPTAGNKS